MGKAKGMSLPGLASITQLTWPCHFDLPPSCHLGMSFAWPLTACCTYTGTAPIEERLRKQQGLSACQQENNTSVTVSETKFTAGLAQICCFPSTSLHLKENSRPLNIPHWILGGGSNIALYVNHS